MLDEHLERKINIERTDDPRREATVVELEPMTARLLLG